MSFIYVAETKMADKCFVKFGISEGPRTRIKQLQIGCPTEIKFVAAWKGNLQDEKSLHDKFWIWRTQGEWYNKVDDIINYINAQKKHFQKV